MKIAISAGGTGGHLFPGLEVGEELAKRGYVVYLLTDQRCVKYLDKNLKIPYKVLSFGMFSSKLKTIYSLIKAFFNSLCFLYKYKPQLIIGFGGYPTFPHLSAAVMLRIPIILHEQNYYLGKTNRFFAKFAKEIALSYQNNNPETKQNTKYIFTGDVVRASIRALPIKHFNEAHSFHLLIFGGSQGAAIFSDIVPQAIIIVRKAFPQLKLSLAQQVVDKSKRSELSQIYNDLKIDYQLEDFFFDMANQFKLADLVISRSGASTIAELSAIGLPAIFIPYPLASENHQFHNAKSLADNQASWLIEQNALSANNLAQKIIEIIHNRDSLISASHILVNRKKDGHKILADTVEKIIKQL